MTWSLTHSFLNHSNFLTFPDAADSSGNALDTMPFPSASSSTSGATNVDKNLSKGTSTVIDLDTVTMADEIEGLERECSVLASAVDTQKAVSFLLKEIRLKRKKLGPYYFKLYNKRINLDVFIL